MGGGGGARGQVLGRLADFHEVIDRAMAASGRAAVVSKASPTGEGTGTSESDSVVRTGLVRRESSLLDRLKSFNGVSIGGSFGFLNGGSLPHGLASKE